MREPVGDVMPYDFTKCDECATLLESSARLYGLCPTCERRPRVPAGTPRRPGAAAHLDAAAGPAKRTRRPGQPRRAGCTYPHRKDGGRQ